MMVWLLGTTHPVMFFLFAFFWGIGYGGAMPPYALFVKDYYGYFGCHEINARYSGAASFMV